MRKDGRTDTTELIVAVRNFASAEKKNTRPRSAVVVVVVAGAKNWNGVARTLSD